MKSFGYLLYGRPGNCDDCLDLAKEERPNSVKLELKAENANASCAKCCRLIGQYIWQFPDKTVQCAENYGECFDDESHEHHTQIVDHATKRLQNRLEQLQNENIDVNVENKDQWEALICVD